MSLPKPYFERDGVVLYHADCRDILPSLPKVDLVLTDPPYGVDLGNHDAASEKRPGWLAKKGYDDYSDTPENFEAIVVPALVAAIRIVGRALVFSAGTQMWSLPRPAAVGAVYLPAGCGRCSWGFQSLAHFLLYGDCPNLNRGAKPIAFSSTERAERNGHPCPKPLSWMKWCVKFASEESDTIIDPFAGSGTTLRAAMDLGHKAIGIEISEKYCEIAARRLEQRNLHFAETL